MSDDLLLIASVSGRALAMAARRAGYRPCVMDLFNDSDTCALTDGRLAPVDPARGFSADELIAGFGRLAAGETPVGFVYGAGFEDRAQVLAELARYWPLCGNLPDVVARAKDPWTIARLCEQSGILHPEISHDLPTDRADWLIKRQGGGGGSHVFPAEQRRMRQGEYFQRRVDGTPVSALVIADGRDAMVLGLSAQWAAPSATQQFRFGGAVRPASPAPTCSQQLCDASSQVARALELRGLNSIDFLVSGDRFHLLEINPRPGATLDIYEDVEGALLRAHVAACRGSLPSRPLVFARARASAIVYAREDLIMPEVAWPSWCRDRQKAGTPVARDEPICTVVAEAETPAAARDGALARSADFLAHLKLQANKVAAL